jgi:hypothetical protein
VVLMVNVRPQEDADVLPFIMRMKYGFTPLRLPDDKWASTVYKISHTPMNYLVGPDGRVYAQPSIADRDERHSFELLVEALLDQAKSIP